MMMVENILKLKNHLILSDSFKKHLEDVSKKVVNYTYNSKYYDYCKCDFYEWSDVTREPKVFTRGRDLFSFLDSCKISYTADDVNCVNRFYRLYASCKKGESTLILTNSIEKLKEEIIK